MYLKITKKFTKHPKTLICVMSIGSLYCLKRERDISVKPILSGVRTAFRCTPALTRKTVDILALVCRVDTRGLQRKESTHLTLCAFDHSRQLLGISREKKGVPVYLCSIFEYSAFKKPVTANLIFLLYLVIFC